MKTTIITVGAIAATAAIGGIAADPGCARYRSLRKPRWQPPLPAYALVWTPLYATIAYAGARALTRAQSRDRSQVVGIPTLADIVLANPGRGRRKERGAPSRLADQARVG